MTFQPDREELAWAAGFFDGEGCFSYAERAREHVQAIVAMLWFKLGPIKRNQALSVLRRYQNVCKRGHAKIHEFAHCPQCVADAWAARRQAKAFIRGQTELALSS